MFDDELEDEGRQILTTSQIDEAKSDFDDQLMSDEKHVRVEKIIAAISDAIHTSWIDARNAKHDYQKNWEFYQERYDAGKSQKGRTSPVDKLDPPKLARIIDLHTARTMQAVIPDRQRMDFFDFIPDSDNFSKDFMQTPQEIYQYAEQAKHAVANDLIDGDFSNEWKMFLRDYFMFGNGFLRPVWDLNIEYRFDRVPNPDYIPWQPNPENPEETDPNFREDIVNGQPVLTPIEPEIWKRRAYRERDMPKMVRINPMNIFFTEMDVANAEECTGFFIYETCRLADLESNEILTGGSKYANLSKVKYSDEYEYVVETMTADSSDNGLGGNDKGWKNELTKKLPKIYYEGRVDLREILDNHGATQEDIAYLAEMFDWEIDKISGWTTFVAEMVLTTETLVRFQPVPYVVDRKGLIHGQLFKSNNKTLAAGIYDRSIEEEMYRNSMLRMQQEAVLKIVRPMYGVIREMMDPKQLVAMRGKIEYVPNGALYMRPGGKIDNMIQPLNINPAPIQISDQSIASRDLDMSEASHLPPVKMGSSSGGATATEVSGMSGSADIMLEEFCMDLESGPLSKVFYWLLILHHQWSYAVKTVRYYNSQGDLVFQQVPPEVWRFQYYVNLTGFRVTGNRAVMAMNFKEFLSVANPTGCLNVKEFLKDYAEVLNIKNPDRIIQDPPPPPDDISDRMNSNISIDFQMQPPPVKQALLTKMNIEVTPEMMLSIGAVYAADRNAAIEQVGSEQEMAAEMDLSTNGGQPYGAEEATVQSMNQDGDESGLRDDIGLQKTMGQKTKNPLNGRRANAI